ncbi:hypothetical protein H0H92_001564, partial [Tricholoma furcatifolium]
SKATVSSDSEVEEVTPTQAKTKKRRAADENQPSDRNKKARPHSAQIEAYLNSWALAHGFQAPQLGEQREITRVALNESTDEEE